MKRGLSAETRTARISDGGVEAVVEPDEVDGVPQLFLGLFAGEDFARVVGQQLQDSERLVLEAHVEPLLDAFQ
jgi:hypothetical protein